METALQEVRALYAVGGIMVFVVIAVMGLLFVVWRSNVKAKEDPTPALIDTQKALINEITESGKRHNNESNQTVKALSGITDELKEGRRVTTGLLEAINTTAANVQAVQAAVANTASAQAARDIELRTDVLKSISDTKAVLLTEVERLINGVTTALEASKRRRKGSPSLVRGINDLSRKISDLQKELKHVQTPPPTPNHLPIDAGVKPIYSVASTGQRTNPVTIPVPNGNGYDTRYPNAPDWVKRRD